MKNKKLVLCIFIISIFLCNPGCSKRTPLGPTANGTTQLSNNPIQLVRPEESPAPKVSQSQSQSPFTLGTEQRSLYYPPEWRWPATPVGNSCALDVGAVNTQLSTRKNIGQITAVYDGPGGPGEPDAPVSIPITLRRPTSADGDGLLFMVFFRGEAPSYAVDSQAARTTWVAGTDGRRSIVNSGDGILLKFNPILGSAYFWITNRGSDGSVCKVTLKITFEDEAPIAQTCSLRVGAVNEQLSTGNIGTVVRASATPGNEGGTTVNIHHPTETWGEGLFFQVHFTGTAPLYAIDNNVATTTFIKGDSGPSIVRSGDSILLKINPKGITNSGFFWIANHGADGRPCLVTLNICGFDTGC